MALSELFSSLDFKGIFAEYIIHGSLDRAIPYFNERFKATKKQKIVAEKVNQHEGKIYLPAINLTIDKSRLEEGIGRLLVETFTQTRDLELDNPKTVLECYVQPHFFPSQKRFQVDKTYPKRLHIEDVFTTNRNNLIILGDLGSGKTTLVKRICQNLLYKESKYFSNLNFPILIRLRDLNSFSPTYPELILFELILQKLGIILDIDTVSSIENTASIKSSSYFLNVKRIICDFLEELHTVILFDGFDEICNKNLHANLVGDFEILSSVFYSSRIVITSRTIEFHYNISNTQTYEIAFLNDDQIDEFVIQYIADRKKAEDFKLQLYATPYFDTSRKPLALAHLCAIYERTGTLPLKPKSVYKKIVSLYIEEWDIKRRIDRKKIGESLSAYNNLSNDRKEEYLSKLSFLLTMKNIRKFTFSENDIFNSFHNLSDEFGLPFYQAKLIVSEIEGHSGLIIQTSNDSFEFAHPSLQEYLCAQYISRMGKFNIPKNKLLLIPNEIAVTLALVSEPNNLLFHLIFECLRGEISNIEFMNVLLHRVSSEKPDFRIEPRLGLIIAQIYSMIKFKGNILSKQYFSDVEISNTISLLAKLVNDIPVVKKSLHLIMYDYVVFEDYEYSRSDTHKDDKFKFLRKKNNIADVPQEYQPLTLAIPDIFE